ncbi:hypothetical protein ACFWAX_35880 [Streptomyces sp. NPDC059956]
MTVIGAAVALGIVATAVAPVAAIAAPAARAAVVAGAVPDAWVEVSNGTQFRVTLGGHNIAPTRVDVRPVGSDVVVATLDKFWYESDTVGCEEPDTGWYEAHDELRLDGMGDYELDVYVPSDGGGVAGRKFKGVSDGTWRVRHVDTDAQHFASTSHTAYLDVRGGTAPCAAE